MAYKLEKVQVLVIDDMKPMLVLVQSVLKAFGFEQIHLAENGEEGFEKVCKYNPDLVITDWMMSPIDGLEFTKMVRKEPMVPNPYVPILMMTGFSSRLRVGMARDYGITEFLSKPFTSRDLYSHVRHIVEKPRQFVDSDAFFGPDRRRKRVENYDGPHRRDNDEEETKKAETAKQKETMKILMKLREETKNISK